MGLGRPAPHTPRPPAGEAPPAVGGRPGGERDFGGLLGKGPIREVTPASPAEFIHRGGKIPAPMQSLKN